MEKEIYKIFKQLNTKFYEIQCRNWIKSRGTGFSAVGETFEQLLEKERDRNILPDYYGIELKTKSSNTNPYIGLFSMALDNKPLRMKRLYEIGGYPSRKDRRYKVLYVKINASEKTKIGFRYSYQLKVDYNNEVIHLLIFDYYKGLLNEDMSWSFTELKRRLEYKLTYLALINAKQYKYNGITYFKYKEINFYELKDFNTFLKLIENGIIRVHIKLSFHTTGKYQGELNDKGTTWEIKEEDIEKLFLKINLDNNLIEHI